MTSDRSVSFISRIGVASILLAVAACSNEPCTGNPATDSLSCLQANGPLYRQRVQAAEAEARDKQRQVADAKARNEQLQTQLADSRAQEADLRARIAAQRSDLDRLSAAIARAKAAGEMSEGEASMRRAQIEHLKRRQAELEQQAADNREKQQKAAALQREIDELKTSMGRRSI